MEPPPSNALCQVRVSINGGQHAQSRQACESHTKSHDTTTNYAPNNTRRVLPEVRSLAHRVQHRRQLLVRLRTKGEGRMIVRAGGLLLLAPHPLPLNEVKLTHYPVPQALDNIPMIPELDEYGILPPGIHE